MLTKTNEVKVVDGKKKAIYVNEITGQEGMLSEHTNIPSSRRETRQGVKSVSVVRTNRKSTKGRRIYFQEVDGKTIKHIQETPNAIRRKEAYLDTLAKIELDAKKYDKSKEK